MKLDKDSPKKWVSVLISLILYLYYGRTVHSIMQTRAYVHVGIASCGDAHLLRSSVGHPAPLLYKPTPPRSFVYQGFRNLPTRKMRKANACVYVCVLLVLIAALEWQVVLSTDQGINGSGVTTVHPASSPSPAPAPAPPLIDCKSECDRRCKVAPRQKACLKFCGICCNACKCVPSGTRGNKDECPCYRDKRSSQGKPKCP